MLPVISSMQLLDKLPILIYISSKTLAKIETHLDTNNATEAWILLAMVAPNIKGHNPERVSKLLLQNLKYDMVSTLHKSKTTIHGITI